MYSIEDTFQVYIDIVVPNADDCETIGLQFRVARFVADCTIPPPGTLKRADLPTRGRLEISLGAGTIQRGRKEC